MNKEIKQDEFKKITPSIIASILVGSHSYGLTNNQSDKDILHIYTTSEDVSTFHQLIFQEQGIDHLLCTSQQLVKNITSGDSLVNFEAIHSEEAKEKLNFLYENRQEFYDFNVIKAYLGFAKRDLKNFYSSINMGKLFHAYRGVLVANKLLKEKTYSNDYRVFSEEEQKNLVKMKKNDLTREEITKIAGGINLSIEALKKELTTKLNTHQIRQGLSSEFKAKLEKEI